MILKLLGAPMCPSSNNCYPGKTRRHKSKKLVSWNREFEKWALSEFVKPEFKCFKRFHNEGACYEINCFFYFHHTSVFCRGSPDGYMKRKKNDVSNRIKIIHDGISNLLGVDDRYFTSGSFAQKICPDWTEERIDVEVVLA